MAGGPPGAVAAGHGGARGAPGAAVHLRAGHDGRRLEPTDRDVLSNTRSCGEALNERDEGGSPEECELVVLRT